MNKYMYLVEGETEEKFINTLKLEGLIVSGKVSISRHFEANIKKLSKNKNIKSVLIIQQVENLEDEIVKSTNIREIKELLGSQSNKNVKSDINKCTNLYIKLKEKEFKIEKIWIKQGISSLSQDSEKIKV